MEDIYGGQVFLRRGVHAENVYGENIVIESGCQIHGEVLYAQELRISEDVWLSSASEKDRISFHLHLEALLF